MTVTPAPIDADVAIVGSGFAGSLTALALLKRGRRVVLVERGRHPRFAIGESSTPLANLLLEELADRYDLPRVRAFSKWGTWQRARPEVACGLKRGFTFFFHEPGSAFADDADAERQLLVAASPHDEIADTHWYRPGLRSRARAGGAARRRHLSGRDPARGHPPGGRTARSLEGERHGRPVRITAAFVIDASGPRGFLHRALRAAARRRVDGCRRRRGSTRTSKASSAGIACVRAAEAPPYPIDDAALHHVFPGGWIWMLRFNNGITSAGAALTDRLAAAIGAAEGAPAWDRLLEIAAVGGRSVPRRHARAAVHPLAARGVPQRTCGGPGWALLPSAAGVIDPLLSTGFPLTLLGILRLVDLAGAHVAGTPNGTRRFATYERDNARRAGRDGAARRGALRDDGRIRRCSSG